MRALLVLGLSLAPLACSSPSTSGTPYTGKTGQPTAATLTENVFVLPVTIDGKSGPQLIVDTGSPVVVVNPASAMGGIPSGIGSVAALGVAGLSFANAAVIGADIIQAPGASIPISGVLGCTILCSLPVAFNYRDRQLTFGAGPLPGAIEATGGDSAFRLAGGGRAQLPGVKGTVDLPASRILVTATIEGIEHPFIIDTGASSVFVRKSLFAKVTADGRGQLKSQVSTVEGEASTTLFRLRSVALGGAEVKSAPAAQSATIDGLLDGVGQEVGQPIDGLLGGTFLREFFVTIDYPASHVSLRRYATRDHIVDEGSRIGIELSSASGVVAVTRVFPGTDAEKQGVKVSDRIASIDGQPTDKVAQSDLAGRISGTVGSSHVVQFGCAGCTGFTGTRTLRVDDLLPLP